jgi:hypothetical protein
MFEPTDAYLEGIEGVPNCMLLPVTLFFFLPSENTSSNRNQQFGLES